MRSMLSLKDGNKVNGKRLGAIAVALISVILIITLFSWLCCCPDCMPSDSDKNGGMPSNGFGNETVGGNFVADAKVLTNEGTKDANGINTMSGGPEILFDDGFESGDFSKWTYYSMPPELEVTDERSYEGEYSAKFDPTYWSAEYLKKSNAFNVGIDEDLHLYFATYIDEKFKTSGTNEENVETLCHVDYFVVKIEFNNEDSLVYLVSGMYSGWSDEEVVDVRDQVVKQNSWVGIAIEDIQNDYKVQFEGSVMPSGGNIRFVVRSRNGVVNIDGVLMKKTPVSEEGNYWSYDDTPIECFFVDVDFKLFISECINESNVWVEIRLWVTILNSQGITVKNKTFLQEALVNVSLFGIWVNWTSICFDFPEDDSIYGGELTYEFDICIEAWGKIEDGFTGAGDWVSAEICKKKFDAFTVVWVTYDEYIIIIIASTLGGLGITGTVLGVRRRKKKCSCNPSDSDCNCDL